MAFLDSVDPPPLRIVEVKDERVGLDAVVVIDHDLFPRCAGGTRMVADVTTDEVARLARAMTWKFAVAERPIAGAKAGVRFTGGDRDAVLAAFLDRAAEIDGFLTGPDIGTYPDDFAARIEGDDVPMWARSHEGMGMDDLAVGAGILGAARVALERLGRRVPGSAVAIEGFGKAGAGTAKATSDAGMRVVAVSTVHGALVDENGLDVAALLALKAEHGDQLVDHGPVPSQARETVFATECDVLVPGARPDVITAASAETLRCGVVVPAANIPYAKGAIEALAARDILALPDFVTNAGGVHLYESPACKDDPAECLREVERLVGDTVARILDAGAPTPTAAALGLARTFLATSSGGQK
jgi:glutamate dehydrogenase (NAD(P)+)